jgi:hypothetical protein
VENDTKSLLMDSVKNSPSAKSTWSADAADLLVLLCSFLLTATSIVLVVLVFNTQATANDWNHILGETLSILQRVISTLSVAITSGVIMVAGKRYVLFKLARGGLRSRKVAVYSNPSIGNIASHIVLGGAEFPLLGLSAVWGLALITGLTVNDSWEMTLFSSEVDIPAPFDPLDLGGPVLGVPVVQYDFTAQYGIYILILNIIVSLVMLIVVVKLRLASHLGPDFINSTRLLLDPLKKPELFNASLKTTMDALADPYMSVREGSEFFLAGRESTGEEGLNRNVSYAKTEPV